MSAWKLDRHYIGNIYVPGRDCSRRISDCASDRNIVPPRISKQLKFSSHDSIAGSGEAVRA